MEAHGRALGQGAPSRSPAATGSGRRSRSRSTGGRASAARCPTSPSGPGSRWTVLRHRAGRHVLRARGVESALPDLRGAPPNLATSTGGRKRHAIDVPRVVDERLGAFLGYLVGDGHISRVKRHLGLTTGDEEQAHAFAGLARTLFGLTHMYLDEGRWRVTGFKGPSPTSSSTGSA